MTSQSDQSSGEVITDRIVFGGGPGLILQTTKGTPYLAIRDVNGAPILTLGVTGRGFVVHRAEGVNDGPQLQPEYDHGDRNL